MYRLLLIFPLAFLAAEPLWAQEDATEPEEAEQEEAPSPEEKITDEEIEALLGLDEDYADIEDDDFEATEQVRFAQSIPFPTDI
jgi:hypothetical protein